MVATGSTVPLRLIVERPPAGVALAVQAGRGSTAELIWPTSAGPDAATFDLVVRARTGASLALLGEIVQGPPRDRFLYVTWGRLANQPDSDWERRAKVSLTDITASKLDALTTGLSQVLEARIEGTSADGGPACATVELLDGGWRLA